MNINDDLKLILLNSLCTIYFILKYQFSIFIPIMSLLIFNSLKLINIYYKYFKYINYKNENKIGYEIYEKYVYCSPLFTLLIGILSLTNMYELQIFLTVLLFLMKIQNYDYVRILKDNYYLVNYDLSKTIIFSTFLLMTHYLQIIKNGTCVNDMCNNKLIIFISQNILYMVEYDIKIIN
jgi:hypothetical protein